MIGPAPLEGGRKSSPVGRSGTQAPLPCGVRLRIETGLVCCAPAEESAPPRNATVATPTRLNLITALGRALDIRDSLNRWRIAALYCRPSLLTTRIMRALFAPRFLTSRIYATPFGWRLIAPPAARDRKM